METLQEMGIKDLESVVLKAHDEMSIAGRVFEQGEPVLYFQNIQVSQLSERAAIRAARGGYLNQPLVVWEDRENTTFQFSNGTLNQISFNMLLEANMVKKQEVRVPFKQIDEIQGDGKFYYRYPPAEDKKKFFYVFDCENIQRKISPLAEGKDYAVFDKSLAGQRLLMDYYFLPKSTSTVYLMDKERKASLYSLEATFYLKDENEGLLHTGILEMPKVYIMSNIDLRMGERANPTVGTFRIVAMPENVDDYERLVYRITYLDEDIYGV